MVGRSSRQRPPLCCTRVGSTSSTITTVSFLAAFNTETGEELWRVERDEIEHWTTPFVWENELRTEMVTTGNRKIRSYALDGELPWELAGMTGNVVPTPFSKHGLVYLSSGYPGANPRPVYTVRPGASGDISLRAGETNNDYIVWYQPRLGTYQTALVYGDYSYTLLDQGFLLSHDALTGREVYGRQRIAPGVGVTASSWAYNGKSFLLGEDGDNYVVEAGPEFEIVGKNSLDDSMRCHWRRQPSFEVASLSERSRSSTASPNPRTGSRLIACWAAPKCVGGRMPVQGQKPVLTSAVDPDRPSFLSGSKATDHGDEA